MVQVLGHLARWTVRRLIRLYYPKIEVSGREHIPRSGPVLLVANHANSLIDPVIVGIAAARPVRFFAKAPLFETPVLGRLMRALGMLPAFRAQDDGAQVRRNLESLNVGAQALVKGAAVGIFPEGKSHDSLKLEQIRSGAARMAVSAIEQGARELKLVPIGINYQRKQLFRSAIWVRVGRPITVVRFMAAHGDDRKAMRALTPEMESRLKHVVIHLTEPAFEPFLDELELLLPPARVRGHVATSALRQRKRLGNRGGACLPANFVQQQFGDRSMVQCAVLTCLGPRFKLRVFGLAACHVEQLPGQAGGYQPVYVGYGSVEDACLDAPVVGGPSRYHVAAAAHAVSVQPVRINISKTEGVVDHRFHWLFRIDPVMEAVKRGAALAGELNE